MPARRAPALVLAIAITCAIACAGLAGRAAAAEFSEQPVRVEELESQAGSPPRPQKIRCLSYAGFMVRTVHDGDDIGTSSVAVAVPSAPCTAELGPRLVVLPGAGSMEVGGAVGRFLLLVWPDGANGATVFSVFDTVTRRKLYTDSVKLDGFTRLAAGHGGDTLELGFVRVLDARCSLVVEGAACWARFSREAKLPPEIVRRGPPLAACAAAYAQGSAVRKQGAPKPRAEDPSVVAYEVGMTIPASGSVKVLSRGELSCWPSE